ncbi:aromatic acid exporter family protein, partial [Bacillus pumilus]
NVIFLPPKYETKRVHHSMENTEEILKGIRLSSRQSTDHSIVKDDIDQIKERMIKLDHMYVLYKEERSYLKKTTYGK